MPSVEEYRAAGLYDPVDNEGTGRLELLDWLDEQGFTLDEIVRGFETNAIGSMAGDRRMVPGERLDRATAIERSGLAADDFDDFSTALGFVPLDTSPADEVGYTEAEIAVLVAVGALAEMFSRESAIGLLRVMGSAIARIAEASVSVFLNDVESSHLLAGATELELAHKVYEAVGLLDELGRQFEPILRRQMLQATERTRRTTVGDLERFAFRYAVGFVDLVGFTAHSRDMPPNELAAFMGEFEGQAHDVATKAGARVVKLIGDEVMFVATNPSAACQAGRALMEAFASTSGVMPRGGLAYGNVVLRGGDYYGAVVNLASRLVDEAVPLELLVTDDLADAATECMFEPAGRRMVKGFDEPVAVHSLRME